MEVKRWNKAPNKAPASGMAAKLFRLSSEADEPNDWFADGGVRGVWGWGVEDKAFKRQNTI